jgi:hypothetical protein
MVVRTETRKDPKRISELDVGAGLKKMVPVGWEL